MGVSHSGDTIVGGVRRVAFVRTEQINSISYNPSQHKFNVVLNQNQNWSVMMPKENAARFVQSVADNSPNVWKMSLEIKTRVSNFAENELINTLKNCLKSGALIAVELNNEEKLLLGYSLKAKCRVPIVLSEAEITTGSTEIKSSMCEQCKLSWSDVSPAIGVNAIF